MTWRGILREGENEKGKLQRGMKLWRGKERKRAGMLMERGREKKGERRGKVELVQEDGNLLEFAHYSG